MASPKSLFYQLFGSVVGCALACHSTHAKPLTEEVIKNAKKIGIMQGSFDPPTLGHLAAAQAAVDAPDGPDIVILVPGNNPHKNPLPREQRLQMLELAVGDREKIYYANSGTLYDTFLHKSPFAVSHLIRSLNPKAKLMLVAGTDLAENEITDFLFQFVYRAGSWEVVDRPGVPDGPLSPTVRHHLESLVKMPPVDASSSAARNFLLAHPEAYANLDTPVPGLDPKTSHYILENKLYSKPPQVSVGRKLFQCLVGLIWKP